MTRLTIKADDLTADVNERWLCFLRICTTHAIPASLGFIAGQETTQTVDRGFLDILQQGQFEIWNHGALHDRDEQSGTAEFFGRDLDAQITAIRTCQNVCETIFGHRPQLFGPPFNLFDSITLRALDEFPEIRCLFDIPYLRDRKTIPKAYYVEREIPAGGRTFDYDIALRDSEKFLVHRVPFVLQIHPGNYWTKECPARFVAFVKVIQACGYRIVLTNEF